MLLICSRVSQCVAHSTKGMLLAKTDDESTPYFAYSFSKNSISPLKMPNEYDVWIVSSQNSLHFAIMTQRKSEPYSTIVKIYDTNACLKIISLSISKKVLNIVLSNDVKMIYLFDQESSFYYYDIQSETLTLKPIGDSLQIINMCGGTLYNHVYISQNQVCDDSGSRIIFKLWDQLYPNANDVTLAGSCLSNCYAVEESCTNTNIIFPPEHVQSMFIDSQDQLIVYVGSQNEYVKYYIEGYKELQFILQKDRQSPYSLPGIDVNGFSVLAAYNSHDNGTYIAREPLNLVSTKLEHSNPNDYGGSEYSIRDVHKRVRNTLNEVDLPSMASIYNFQYIPAEIIYDETTQQFAIVPPLVPPRENYRHALQPFVFSHTRTPHPSAPTPNPTHSVKRRNIIITLATISGFLFLNVAIVPFVVYVKSASQRRHAGNRRLYT